jgi:hypothetical protein
VKKIKYYNMHGHHIHATVKFKNKLGGVLFICDSHKNYKERLVLEPVEGFLSELDAFELLDQLEVFFNNGVKPKAFEKKENIVYWSSTNDSGYIKLYASNEDTDVLIGYLPGNLDLRDYNLATLVCYMLNGDKRLEQMFIDW